MFCKHYGAQIDDGSEVCPVCGKTQEEAAVEANAQTAPAQQADEKPTGLKKIFLLIGAIASCVAIILTFGLFFGSGLSVAGFNISTTMNYLDFGKGGIIDLMKSLAGSSSTVGDLMQLIFSFIVVCVLLISLVVYVVLGAFAFIRVFKKQDYEKIGKVATRVFETFTTSMLIFLLLNAAEGLKLNGCALAAIILGALLIATNLVMHLLTRGFGLLNLKRILAIVFTGLILCCGAIIAGLASGSTFVIKGGESYGMFAALTSMIGHSSGPKMLAYAAVGFMSALVLVSLGVQLLRIAMNNVQAIGDNKAEKMEGLKVSITALVFSVLFVVAHFLYAGKTPFNPAIPIVIAVFAIVCIVSSVLAKKFAQDAQNK